MHILRHVAWPAMFLVVPLAAVAFTALRVGLAVAGERASSARRATTVLATALIELVAIAQLLAMVSLLSRVPLLLAALGIAAVTAARVPATRLRWPSVPDTVDVHLVVRAAVVAVAAGLLAFGLVSAMRKPSAESDTLQYHVPNSASWMSTHNLWHLPAVEPGYLTNTYPSNAELIDVWFMAPSGSDQFGYLTNLLWGALAVAATALITEELGGRAAVGALAALALAGSPLVASTQANSLMTDLAATSGVLAAVGLCLSLRRTRPDAGWFPWLCAGLCLGLSTGSKYTALAPAVLVFVWLLVLLRSASQRVRAAAGLVGGALALTGVWLVRNAVRTGNPFFPQGLTLAGHSLLPSGDTPLRSRFNASMFDQLAHWRSGPIATWRHALTAELGPVLALLAVGVVAALLLGWRDEPRRRRLWLCTALLACTWAVSYLVIPYTGGGREGAAFAITSQLRYALPFAALAVALFAALRWTWVVSAACGLCILWDAWKLKQGAGFRPDLRVSPSVAAAVVAAALVALGVAAAMVGFKRQRRPTQGLAPLVGGVLVVGALAVAAVGFHHRPRTPTWAEYELRAAGLPPGPIAAVGVSDVRVLLGRHFDVRMVSLGGGRSGTELPLTAAAIDAAIERTRPVAVAVSTTDNPTLPPGYRGPAGWRWLAAQGGTSLWVAPGG